MRLAFALLAALVLSPEIALARSGLPLRAPEHARASEPTADQRIRVAFDSSARPAPSSWKTRQADFYMEGFAGTRADVLVVPFQVENLAVGAPARSLMTALFVKALAEATQLELPDPYLVARALGDGHRAIEKQRVYRLADQLGATVVLWGYVGHGPDGSLRFSLTYWDRQGSKAPAGSNPPLTQHYPPGSFSDEQPPIEAFRSMLPSILQSIGVGMHKPAAKSPTRAKPPSLPEKLVGMLDGGLGPAARVRYFHLLAALTPRYADRTRSRYAEKAYLALLDLPAASPAHRALKARTYLYLGERPAALAALGKPSTAEEGLLLGLMNGNLPQAQRLLRDIPGDAARLVAELEVNAMALAYDARTHQEAAELAGALALPSKAWTWLVYRGATDREDWAQFENAIFKGLLDQELPVPGYGLEELLRGAGAIGDPASAQTRLNLSIFEHTRRVLARDPRKWCCAPAWGRPALIDIVDFFDAIGTDNLMRRIRFLSETQGRPQDALGFAQSIASIYADHPQLAINVARAEKRLAETANPSARAGLLQSAAKRARTAMYWEQGQTPTAADAFQFNPGIHDPDKDRSGNYYGSDLPYRAFYPGWDSGGMPEVMLKNHLAKLSQSTYEFDAVEYFAWLYGTLRNEPANARQLFQSIEGRFDGQPDLPLLLATHYRATGDLAKAEQHYEAGLRSQPGNWHLHEQFGRFLFAQGHTARAANVMMKYSGFKPDAKEHPVRISNFSYEAGSLFYWAGYLDLAVPFFRVAAATDSGSGASMSSELRIHLIERNLEAAALVMQRRARRYPSGYSYRDYLGLLHSRGDSKNAWAVFNALAPQMTEPEIWESALAGHRMSGQTEEQVFEWARQDVLRKAGADTSYASLHLVRSGITDRTPSPQLAALVREIARPAWKMARTRYTARPSLDGSRHLVLGPRANEGATLPFGVFDASEKEPLKSELEYFVEGYRAIRIGRFAEARDTFAQASALYDLSFTSMGYMLPYYAFAAGRSGGSAAVTSYLDAFDPLQEQFDYHMARGVLAALSGKHDEADKHLLIALHRRPYTRSRAVQVEYQYAELCEWLFETTREPRYRARALAWVKSHQLIQPWHAWAYAVEAALVEQPEDRRRAIGIAHFLDRNSERLARLPRAEIEAAVKALGKRNPFLQESRPSDKRT
jgi:hypothetical protein